MGGGFDVIFFLSLSLVVADTKVLGAEIYILQYKHFLSPREAIEGFLPDHFDFYSTYIYIQLPL